MHSSTGSPPFADWKYDLFQSRTQRPPVGFGCEMCGRRDSFSRTSQFFCFERLNARWHTVAMLWRLHVCFRSGLVLLLETVLISEPEREYSMKKCLNLKFSAVTTSASVVHLFVCPVRESFVVFQSSNVYFTCPLRWIHCHSLKELMVFS